MCIRDRWSDEFKKEMGLTWHEPVVPEPYDERFYWSANSPKNLEDVNVVDEDGNAVMDIVSNKKFLENKKVQMINKEKYYYTIKTQKEFLKYNKNNNLIFENL